MDDETVWLTQAQMVKLFQKSKQNVSLHIRNIFAEGELDESSVVKEYLTTAKDGKRYKTNHYNLDVIISVGYRVKSHRGTQFRIWATQQLREYLIKGFVINDERLEEGRSKIGGQTNIYIPLLLHSRTNFLSDTKFLQIPSNPLPPIIRNRKNRIEIKYIKNIVLKN